MLYLRDFQLLDEAGEKLVSATTSWLVIDMNTRRMVRNQDLADNPEKCVFEHAIEQPADKIVLPAGVEPVLAGTHKTVWSDIDNMGHVNNVKYVYWALDAIDEGVLRERLLKEILVNYDAEVLLGETVELYSIKQESEDELVYYMQGVVDGKSKFSVKLVF